MSMRMLRWLSVVVLLLAGSAAPARAESARCGAQSQVVGVLEMLAALGTGFAPVQRALEQATLRAALRYADHCVRLNQVQVLGSHNSYHIQPIPQLISIYITFDPTAIQLEYTHRPLAEQFGLLGIRQIELDVFHDPEGGLYAMPIAYQILHGAVEHPDYIPPGTKTFHIQDIDWDSRCPMFTDCLAQILAWSDANPGHLPIAVLVEFKDEAIDLSPFQAVVPLPWDAAALDVVDAEIRGALPAAKIITPDDVRGSAPTLEDAVLADGWPALAQARGRVLFLMDNGGGLRDVYRQGSPSLEGRVLFTNATPGDADAAFVKVNGPVGNEALIQDLVGAGYIVRTRADADTLQARVNDTSQRDAAIASAAQYVSTDYPEPDPDFTDYHVLLPGNGGGARRCNPVSAGPGCRDFALER